jgi:hypothetical protein
MDLFNKKIEIGKKKNKIDNQLEMLYDIDRRMYSLLYCSFLTMDKLSWFLVLDTLDKIVHSLYEGIDPEVIKKYKSDPTNAELFQCLDRQLKQLGVWSEDITRENMEDYAKKVTEELLDDNKLLRIVRGNVIEID